MVARFMYILGSHYKFFLNYFVIPLVSITKYKHCIHKFDLVLQELNGISVKNIHKIIEQLGPFFV